MILQASGQGCIAGLLPVVRIARVYGHELVAHVSRIPLLQLFKEHGYGSFVREEPGYVSAVLCDFHGTVGPMVPVLNLDAGAGRDNVTRNLASGPVFDYQVCPVYSRVDLCPVTFVCAASIGT